jgi:hypothetical protein
LGVYSARKSRIAEGLRLAPGIEAMNRLLPGIGLTSPGIGQPMSLSVVSKSIGADKVKGWRHKPDAVTPVEFII